MSAAGKSQRLGHHVAVPVDDPDAPSALQRRGSLRTPGSPATSPQSPRGTHALRRGSWVSRWCPCRRVRWWQLAAGLLTAVVIVGLLHQLLGLGPPVQDSTVPDDVPPKAELPTGPRLPERPFSNQGGNIGVATAKQLAALQNIAPVEAVLPNGALLELFHKERQVGSSESRQVQRDIVAFLDSRGFTVTRDEFVDATPLGNRTFCNLIATRNPDAPQRLILAAHYDTKILAGQRFVGAIDSAVPCAMLLDLADVVHRIPGVDAAMDALNTTLEFVFFDGEEAFREWTSTDSIYGARHLAARWESEQRLANISTLVLLDLIGAAAPVFMPLHDRTRPTFLQLAQAEQRLRMAGLVANAQLYFWTMRPPTMPQNAVEDDHVPFLTRNVPVLHLVPPRFPPQWHSPTDDWQHLDPLAIRHLVLVFRVFIAGYFNLFGYVGGLSGHL